MNYKKIYENLIESRKLLNRIKVKKNDSNYIYYEVHHIIPRSLGGKDEKENLVLLTAREHFIAHLILSKCYEGEAKKKMALALSAFCKSKNYKLSARQSAYIKELRNKVGLPNEVKKRMSETRTGKKQTKEHCERRVKSRKQNNKEWVTKETKSKISLSIKKSYENGRKKSVSIFKKGSTPWNIGKKYKKKIVKKGWKRTPESIEKTKTTKKVKKTK